MTTHNVIETDLFATAVVILQLMLSANKNKDLLKRLSECTNKKEYVEIARSFLEGDSPGAGNSRC